MNTSFKRILLVGAALLAGLVLVNGCGMDQSPMAAEEDAALVPESKGYLVLSFGDGELTPAAKKVKKHDDDVDKRATQTKKIGKEGGKLKVGSKFGQGGQDDLMVKLEIPKGALDHKVYITMTLVGLDEGKLVLEFDPSGLEFLKDAKLTVKMGKDYVNSLETVEAYHVSDAGTEGTEAGIEEYHDYFEIRVKVPGFSRYSLNGDFYANFGGF